MAGDWSSADCACSCTISNGRRRGRNGRRAGPHLAAGRARSAAPGGRMPPAGAASCTGRCACTGSGSSCGGAQGLAGTAAAPASSALIVRARAPRAWLEPLIPALRRVRRDTCFPAAVSLLAARRAWPMPDGTAVAAPGPWSCCGAVLVLAAGPGRASGAGGAAWSWAAPAWSPADQARDRSPAGPPVPVSGVSAAVPASARSMWASVVPMPRTRTGRQDTIMVTGHGARAAPAWASR